MMPGLFHPHPPGPLSRQRERGRKKNFCYSLLVNVLLSEIKCFGDGVAFKVRMGPVNF
jgi:hypothetical protein